MRKILSASIAVALLAGASMAQALTTTGKLNVSVTVTANCTVSNAPLPIAYLPGAGPASATATMTVACSPGTSPTTVAFDYGVNGGSAALGRFALLGGNKLNYNIFKDAAWTTPLGGATTLSAAGATFAAPLTLTIYGQVQDIVANQALAAGTYLDTVTATLTF
jgi:spore coat protein U-like protein